MLLGLAKTKLENNICIFQSGFFHSVSLEKYERLDWFARLKATQWTLWNAVSAPSDVG